MINLLGRPSAQALFVTFLWSTSWILIKVGLAEIPPLTFAGLRYTFAFLILLPAIKRYRTDFFFLSRVHWFRLILLGLLFYALTQGGQFVTLSYLPATTFNMLLNFTSVFVLVFGAVFLSERPSRFQLLGLMVFLLGIVAYFYPVSGFEGQTMGLVFAGITVISNAAASVLGRLVNRERRIPPVLVTIVSMGVGALILLALGLIYEEVPEIDLVGWLIIAWLAVVNTAFAFTLWNRTLQELSAMESSLINSSMLVQIALLAWIFLGERFTPLDIAGLVLATVGIGMVHRKQG